MYVCVLCWRMNPGLCGRLGKNSTTEHHAILKSDAFNNFKGHAVGKDRGTFSSIKDTPRYICPCGYTLTAADTPTVERDRCESPHM